MSDEDQGKIEATFITKLGAKYPFVQAKGCNEAFGIKFFPSVYVIAPDGTVFSVPEDRMPDEATIERLLEGVSLLPKLPDDSRYEPLAALWKKKEHQKIGEWLTRMLAQPNLDPAMREVFEGQQKELEKRAAAAQKRVDRLGQGPDYLQSQDQLADLEKAWKGFAAADAAKQQLARFGSDPAIKKELAASRLLQKLVASYDPSKRSQAKKLGEELDRFAKKHEGTYAARQALQQRERLPKD